MKKRSSRPTVLSSARWLAYATAGLATAAGSAATAEAEVHYSGVIDQVFDGTSQRLHRSFPLSNGVSLTFSQFASGAHLYDAAYFGVKGAAVSNAFRGSYFFASRLHPRQNVASGHFYDITARRFPAILVGIYSDGRFARPGTGFVAFRFNTGRGMQYGWARVQVSGAPRNRFIVQDYAWADPAEAIVAGQKHTATSGDPVQEESALGLLALGGTGLVAWRRRNTADR